VVVIVMVLMFMFMPCQVSDDDLDAYFAPLGDKELAVPRLPGYAAA
jgi:hypothetical protein